MVDPLPHQTSSNNNLDTSLFVPAIRSQKWRTPTPSILCCSQKKAHPWMFPKAHPWMLHSIIKLPHNESPVDTFFVQSNPNNHNTTTTDDADAMPKQTKTGRLISQQPRPNLIQQNPDDVLKWLCDVVNATDTYLYGIKDYRQTKPIMHTKPHTATSPKQTHNNEAHSQRFATVHIYIILYGYCF